MNPASSQVCTRSAELTVTLTESALSSGQNRPDRISTASWCAECGVAGPCLRAVTDERRQYARGTATSAVRNGRLLFTASVLAFNAAKDATSEFAIGSVLVSCIGQLGYVAVPAQGPIHHLADQFQQPLRGGMFFDLVLQTVAAGGAMKDVFPSLHTAGPVWFALFSIRRVRRMRAPGRVVAAVVSSFFAANIMVSTVVLRWHHWVDVIAGFALAAGAAWVAPRLAEWERRVRAERGFEPAWAIRGRARRLSDPRA